MMKLITVVSMLIVTSTAMSQAIVDEVSQMRLNGLSNRFDSSYRTNLVRAKEFLLESGLTSESRDHRLYGITNANDLLFLKDHNANAAFTTSTSGLHEGEFSGYNVEGEGMTIAVWEVNMPRISHQELDGNVTLAQGDAEITTHATHVHGTVVGKGVISDAKGMAPKAVSLAYTSANDDSEMASQAAGGLLLSNHSYGFLRGWGDDLWYGNEDISDEEDYLFGFYDGAARAWDQIAYQAPYYLIVTSAGNDRNDSGSGFPPDGNEGDGYDCISHGALGKNVLSVGAIKPVSSEVLNPSDVLMSSFSSWGPADDGRIKPDVVGAGVGIFSASSSADDSYAFLQGTSMASPNVAGSLLLVQEYSNKLNDKFLFSSTLKGLAIHTAKEAGISDGPDYQFGWGLLNAEGCINMISRNGNDGYLVLEDTLKSNETLELSFTVSSSDLVKSTIVWLDPAGSPVSASLDPTDVMLVHDLDIRIFDESDKEYMPWILDGQNPSLAAIRGDNIVDNVEQIQIDSPIDGDYRIVVSHKGVLSADQPFSLILSYKTVESHDPYHWLGEANDSWSDGAKWSDTKDGAPLNQVPGKDDIVIIDIAQDENIEINLASDVTIARLSTTGEGSVKFSSSNGSSMNVNSDWSIIANTTFEGLSNIDFSGIVGNRSLLDFGNNTIDVPISFDNPNATWVVNNLAHAEYLTLSNGNIELDQDDLSVGELSIEDTWPNGSFLMNKSVNVLRTAIIDSDLFLEQTSFKFSDESINDKSFETNGATIGSLQVNSGSMSILGMSHFQSLSLTNVVRLELEANSTQTIDDLLISNEASMSISSTTSDQAIIFSNVNRRACFDNIQVSDVDLSGSTLFVGGSSSSFNDSNGWIPEECSDHLFADFEVGSYCANQPIQFDDLSSGNPVSWLWTFGVDDESSLEQNPEFFYAESGIYNVNLTIENSLGSSISYEHDITIINSPIENPTFEVLGDFLLSSVVADSYAWYRDSDLISTSSTASISGHGEYYLEVTKNGCVFMSEPLIILGIDSTILGINIYPNPLDSEVNISISNDLHGKIEVTIYDLNGRKLKHNSYYKSTPLIVKNLDLSNFEAGTYLLNIHWKERNTTIQIQKK